MQRLTCSIPGCNYTRHNREGFTDWICRKHWMMAPKKSRSRIAAAKRRGKRRLAWWLWDRCRADIVARCMAGGDL